MSREIYLILGARGLVGRGVIAVVEAQGGCEILGKPQLQGVTHVIYAALQGLRILAR